MNQTPEGQGMGWLPDYPDFRDHTSEQGTPPPGEDRSVPILLREVGVAEPADAGKLPASVDLRDGFSPVEDQGNLGSCTANAAAGIVEYFERSASGKYQDASRLFLYKATRNIMGQEGDTGAFLRTTMQALVLFGVPPEDYWPYDIAMFDVEPSAFAYAFGQDYKAVQYYRLDPPATSPDQVLSRLKTNLAAKLPAMFGFTVYSSYRQSSGNGAFPYPTNGEKKVGGHAVVAAGYDDEKKVRNASPGGRETTGAILIRNSWSTQWGDQGYGWLPYEYLTHGIASDWWSLLKSDWVDSGAFGI